MGVIRNCIRTITLLTTMVIAMALVPQLAFADEGIEINENGVNDEVWSLNDILFYQNCIDEDNGGGSDCSDISGSTIEEKIWSGLTSFLTAEQAAGVMGNMAVESGFNPARHETTFINSSPNFNINSDTKSSYGIGLIQWSYGRRTNLYKHVSETAPDLWTKYVDEGRGTYGRLSGAEFLKQADDAEANKLIGLEICFLKHELETSYSDFMKTESVEEAADYFLFKVERPADPEGSKKGRRKNAEKYYDQLKGTGTPNNPEDNTIEDPGDDNESDEPFSKSSGAGYPQKIAEAAFQLAYPKSASSSDYHENGSKPNDGAYPGFVKATKALGTWPGNKRHGPDCGYFVKAVIATADTKLVNKPHYHVMDSFQGYAKKHPKLWDVMDYSGKTIPASDLQSGDVIWWRNGPSSQHYFIVAENPDDHHLYVVEASYGGGDGDWGHVGRRLKKSSKLGSHNEQFLYRAKGGESACNSNSSGSGNINGTAVSLAWPKGTDKSKTVYPSGSPTDAFKKAHEKVTPGSTDAAAAAGASCDMFVSTTVRWAGYDKEYPLGSVNNQYDYVTKHSDLWEVTKWNGSKKDVAGGDIIIEGCSSSGGNCSHTFVIVEDEKKDFYIAEASYASYYGRIDPFRKPKSTAFRIRAKKGTNNSNTGISVTNGVSTSSSDGSASNGSTKGNHDIGATARFIAWPEGTSFKKTHNSINPQAADAWEKMLKENNIKSRTQIAKGRSCVVFVWGVLYQAGLVKKFKIAQEQLYQQYLTEDMGWEMVGHNLKESELQDGDVLIDMNSGGGGFPNHHAIYIKDNDGKGHIVEASRGGASGAKGHYGVIQEKYRNISNNLDVWRNKNNKKSGNSAGGDGCVCTGKDDDDGSGGALKDGGVSSVQEGKKIADAYNKANLSKLSGLGDACGGNYHLNCVNLSKWFIAEYLPGMTHSFAGNGGDIANNFYNNNKDKFPELKVSKKPVAYSIFSIRYGPLTSSTAGHTGVILGINGDKIIFAEAGWCSFGGRVKEVSAKTFTSHKQQVYIDVNAYIKQGGK